MLRNKYLGEIEAQFRVHPICCLLGPRQVGKTTLANMYIEKHPPDKVRFFDLENPADLVILDNPMLALSKLTDHLIVIDEIQRRPELFPILRVLADQKKNRKFLILGSASRDLIKQSSETLAGRIGYLEITPFSLQEVTPLEQLWLRGGFPRSFLTENNSDSYRWREAYISTFLERDIPNLGFQTPANTLRRFWTMLAHYHAQIFNGSEIGRAIGASGHTIRHYLDILEGTFMVRILTPWFENLGKRQVKSPKIFFRDSGILHTLIGIREIAQLEAHPKLGFFWEGFALEEIIRRSAVTPGECFFWSTQSGAELDLMIIKEGKRIGYEFKYMDAPRKTPSMEIALKDLKLDHLYVIYPRTTSYHLTENITVCGLSFNTDSFTIS